MKPATLKHQPGELAPTPNLGLPMADGHDPPSVLARAEEAIE